MKKALIIASCGLLLALIIGANTQSKVGPSDSDYNGPLLERKCTEDVNSERKSHECAFMSRQATIKRTADLFLRDSKRKARRAYA